MMTPLLAGEESVLAALREVVDPELGLNVVDLGLVYGVGIVGRRVHVLMTLTTEGCPLHQTMLAAAEQAIRLMVPGVQDVAVELTWDPPWTPDRVTPHGRQELGWR
jgi:metal-sulfur cluster biosynthetic enzyme